MARAQDCTVPDPGNTNGTWDGQPPPAGILNQGDRADIELNTNDKTAEHGDLVPQYEELDVLGGGRAAHEQDQPKYLSEDQTQQAQ